MGGYRIVKKYRSKSGRRATVRKPYGSRYDNDFFVAIQAIKPVRVILGAPTTHAAV